MTWKDEMHEAVAKYLRSLKVDCVSVERFNEDADVFDMGGCETCGHTYDVTYNVAVTYQNSKGNTKVHYYNGSFVDLMRNIT